MIFVCQSMQKYSYFYSRHDCTRYVTVLLVCHGTNIYRDLKNTVM